MRARVMLAVLAAVSAEPNFYNREIYYLDGQIMEFMPETGDYKVKPLQLPPYSSPCTALPEEPLAAGSWPQYKYHKILWLGRDRIMFVNPTTGEWKIACWTGKLGGDPAKDPAADVQASGMRPEFVEKEVIFFGNDEVMAYSPTTGEYHILMYDRNAGPEPMRLGLSEGTFGVKLTHSARQANPFPGRPVLEGNWTVGGGQGAYQQIVYVGRGRAIVYDGAQGRYWMRDYDRGSTNVEASIWKNNPEPIAVGTFPNSTNAAITYVGNDLLWFYQPEDCQWALYQFNRDAKGHAPVLGKAFAWGTFCKDPVFSVIDSCEACSANPLCGWCGAKSKCMIGTKASPCAPNECYLMENWRFVEGTCPTPPCQTYKSCTKCVADPFCGWCVDLETCAEGNKDNPYLTACRDWRHYQCPWVKDPFSAIRPDSDGSLCPPMPYAPPYDISFLQTQEGVSQEDIATMKEHPHAEDQKWECKQGRWVPAHNAHFE